MTESQWTGGVTVFRKDGAPLGTGRAELWCRVHDVRRWGGEIVVLPNAQLGEWVQAARSGDTLTLRLETGRSASFTSGSPNGLRIGGRSSAHIDVYGLGAPPF